jgi:hypothetical protein
VYLKLAVHADVHAIFLLDAVVSRDEYMGGLMDAIGELNRVAVLRATARDMNAVRKIRDVVDTIHHQLMLFDWRNGALRRKYDGIKYSLKKLEQMIYELTLAEISALAPKGFGDEGPRDGAAIEADGNDVEGDETGNGEASASRSRPPKRARVAAGPSS